jgi:hypothetical protein
MNLSEVFRCKKKVSSLFSVEIIEMYEGFIALIMVYPFYGGIT